MYNENFININLCFLALAACSDSSILNEPNDLSVMTRSLNEEPMFNSTLIDNWENLDVIYLSGGNGVTSLFKNL